MAAGAQRQAERRVSRAATAGQLAAFVVLCALLSGAAFWLQYRLFEQACTLAGPRLEEAAASRPADRQ
jgi:hypothetical protein